MSEQKIHSGPADTVRQRAEKIVREKAVATLDNMAALTPEEIESALHELRVHQIELDIQNDELRNTQADLEASRACYFDLYDLAPVGYCTISERGVIIQANFVAATLFSATRDALVKTRFARLIFKDDQDIYFRFRRQLFETGYSQACELRMAKNDGLVFWAHLEATVAWDADGAEVGRVVISDITTRKLAEEALRISETKFRTLYDSTSDAVMLLDKQGFMDCNQATLCMFGCATLEEFSSIHPADLSPPQQPGSADSFTLANEMIATAMEKGSNHFDWVHKRCDTGESFFADVRLTSMKLEGKLIVQALVRDVTELKQAEAALIAEKQAVETANEELMQHRNHLEELVHERTIDLAEARDAAESASRAKSAFLASMGHELRTPMHHITGLGQMLAKAVKDERTNDLVAKLQSASWQLLKLINDILDCTRMEAGQIHLETNDFSLADMLDHAENQARKAATVNGIELVREVAPGLPAVLKGDPTRIGQILDNLLSNAVKFSEGGRITLRVRKVDTDMNNITLRFEVEDQGIGITQELQEGLFQLFNQGDNSLTRKYGGTGLGLALCKRLAALMGGEIGVISNPGQGSTFWFTVQLPVGETPYADTVETGPVDWSQAAAAVDDLDKLLADNNGQAKILWKKSRHLVGAVLHDQLTEFEEAIQGYHFETALMLLRESVAAVPELSINEQTGVT